MKRKRIVVRGRLHRTRKARSRATRSFVWESLALGVFGAVVSVVVGAMAAGVLNSANIQLPLSLQLFLMSDTFELQVLPSALGGAIALIVLVTGAHALAHRAFRLHDAVACANTRTE